MLSKVTGINPSIVPSFSIDVIGMITKAKKIIEKEIRMEKHI